jgi:uncharacterized protein (DUF697 family)
MAQEPSAPGTPEAQAEATAPKSSASPEAAKMTAERRDELATKLVDRFAIWAGIAGVLPIPAVDLVVVGGLQLQMLRRLSQIYEVPFSANRGKSLIAALAGALIPASSGIGAASVLKAVPFVGEAISVFVMPVLSAGATYAIGKVFIQHFASGGTLLDFNPPDYREFLKLHKEMWDKRSTSSAGEPQPGSSGHADPSVGAATTSS